VLEIADRITVLRRGKKIDTIPREGATEDTLARMMVGREVLLRVEKKTPDVGDVLLEVRDLSVRDERGLPVVRDVSLTVRAGEIVGLAGVEGNGQSELIEAITGLRGHQSGELLVAGGGAAPDRAPHARRGGRPHSGGPAAPRPRAGVLDRREHRPPRLQPAASTRASALCDAVQRPLADQEFDVRGGGRRRELPALSGGNQQKLVAARGSRATRRC
jgi:simple sugar transport system ATP-binding protein